MKTRWIVGKPAGKLLRARVQRRLPHSIRDVYIRLKNVVTLTRTYVARNRVHIATTLYILEMDRRTSDRSIVLDLYARSINLSCQQFLCTPCFALVLMVTIDGVFLSFPRLRTVYFADRLRSIVEERWRRNVFLARLS